MSDDTKALVPVASGAPSKLDMPTILEAVIKAGVTPENLAVVRTMMEMEAKRAFAEAFTRLQAALPKVQATVAVPNSNGTVRYRFAPFEAIMDQVRGPLAENGFTVSFSQRFEGDRMVETCTLMHAGGHSRSTDFAGRVGKGPPGCTETQADGAAGSYFKRFALCDALGIVISHLDNDARAEGGAITQDQADELERRVALLNLDRAGFLKYAHAENFAAIHVAVYPILDDFLRRKESKGK